MTTMSDEEIVKTVAYMKGVVRKKFSTFSHVDDIVNEVSIAVMNVIQRCDTSIPGYRGFIYRGVMNHISNYWYKYFWDKERKIAKPIQTVEHINREGKSLIDRIPDNNANEDVQIMRIRLSCELDKLSERERDIFEMICIDGASVADAALKHHISVNRTSQICIATRLKLSKRLSAYRGNSSSYDHCKQCGNACREGFPLCDNCRAENRRVTLKKTADKIRRAKGVPVRNLQGVIK